MALEKWGPHYKTLQNLSVSTHLNLGLTEPSIWGHLAAGNCKHCGHLQYFAEKPQGRTLNESLTS